jgi:hypothetical protein
MVRVVGGRECALSLLSTATAVGDATAHARGAPTTTICHPAQGHSTAHSLPAARAPGGRSRLRPRAPRCPLPAVAALLIVAAWPAGGWRTACI